MSRLIGLLYLLSAILTLFLLVPGCASLHDPTWDIEARPTKEITHIKGHLRPEEKRADQLAPKEISELKIEYPEAFLPALPAINEGPNMSPRPVAPERVWSIYQHDEDEADRIQLPIIILDIDPEIPVPDGPST